MCDQDAFLEFEVAEDGGKLIVKRQDIEMIRIIEDKICVYLNLHLNTGTSYDVSNSLEEIRQTLRKSG